MLAARPCCPSRLLPARIRRTLRARSSSRDDSPWWSSLDELHLVVFAAGTPEEAVYTTQSESGGGGAFVAFQDSSAAARLAEAVSLQTRRTDASVSSVPPLALLLLAREAQYELVVVPRGLPFDAPPLPETVPETVSSDDRDAATLRAQAAAAGAVRRALLSSLRSLSSALSSSQVAAPPEEGDEAPPPRLAGPASAVTAALRALSRRRLEALFGRGADDVKS